jgi:hypothetical protein
MEYVRERGTFEDLPFDQIMEEFLPVFGRMLEGEPPVDAAFGPSSVLSDITKP